MTPTFLEGLLCFPVSQLTADVEHDSPCLRLRSVKVATVPAAVSLLDDTAYA
jgi:hypothetical protein